MNAVAIACILASTVLAPAIAVAEAEPDQIAALRQTLDRELTDYPTARFRDVRIVRRPSNQFVQVAACGWVNAQGPAGGYSGWARFVALDERLQFDRDPIGRRAIQVWCDGADVVVLAEDVTAAVTARTSSND